MTNDLLDELNQIARDYGRHSDEYQDALAQLEQYADRL